jgi:hypothetical protein
VSFIKRSADFDATVDVAVRHNPVEECLNADRLDLSSREKAQTATVGVELGNWLVRRPHRWTVAATSDVVPVADSVMVEVRRVGFPFWSGSARSRRWAGCSMRMRRKLD